MESVESAICYLLPKSRLEEIWSRLVSYELLVDLKRENTETDFGIP